MQPWIETSRDLSFTGRIFRLFRAGFRSPASGKAGLFDVMEVSDWVNVIAVTPDDHTLLVRQFRYGTREVTLEFPAGTVDEGEEPEATAPRELAEETGGHALRWTKLGASRPNPAIQNNVCHHFLADGVQIASAVKFDEHEEIELVRVPLKDIDHLIANGSITHALAVVTWHLFKEHRRGTP